MTPQEIIKEIQKLPPADWQKIKNAVEKDNSNGDAEPITEEELHRILYAKGVIGNVPDLSKWTDEDEDWEPVEIKGRLVSEIIIEDRR